ncbi:Hypothetical predicted protein [Mytilus galloprovincialis]|uniref:Uncharacterized protein n=1 Tax=Mytilus galloprovincialis TaxID=29158 RepID=A0A8B6DWN9_MYTGA|nr:Hypothetical predicted protein [Mytilus galloprovincialis]
MEKLNMLSLNKQKNSSEGPNFEKEDASMQEFISCSGTVGKTEETPSLGELSFDFKMDCADISNVNPEKEGIVTQCLEELENKLRKKHQKQSGSKVVESAEEGARLKRLTYLVKEKKEILNERYLRAVRNMSTPSTEKPETEANTISKLQEELRELRGFLEPSHRGLCGRRLNRGRGRGGRKFPSV